MTSRMRTILLISMFMATCNTTEATTAAQVPSTIGETEQLPTTTGEATITNFTSTTAETTPAQLQSTTGETTAQLPSTTGETTTAQFPSTTGQTTAQLPSTTGETTTAQFPSTTGQTTAQLPSTTGETTTAQFPSTTGQTTAQLQSTTGETTTAQFPSTTGQTTAQLPSTTGETTTAQFPSTTGQTTAQLPSTPGETTAQLPSTIGETNTTSPATCTLFDVSNGAVTQNQVDGSFQVQCNSGFTLRGREIVQCQLDMNQNEKFGSVLPECKKIKGSQMYQLSAGTSLTPVDQQAKLMATAFDAFDVMTAPTSEYCSWKCSVNMRCASAEWEPDSCRLFEFKPKLVLPVANGKVILIIPVE